MHHTPELDQRGSASPSLHQRGRASPSLHQRGRASPSLHQRGSASPSLHQRGRASPSLHQRGRASPSLHQRSRASPSLHQRGRASPSLHQRKTVSSEPHQLIRRPQTSLHTSLLRNILTNQEMMMDQMKIIFTTVQGLKSVAEEIGVEPNLLPLADRQSVENLEERLRNSPDLKNQLRNALALTGGGDVKECVKRVMGATLTHSLAKNINMRGLNGKIGFQHLQIKDVVIAAVRRNRLTSDATDQEIENRITKWLQNAPDRNGGRSERMRRKEQ
ncbi:uncharacterized protein LOC125885642 [Epinephelus fuscoguttatus]|uniref:uncharacterized protein LOC125885642 n=1 Tax=Epinephelus fuscoguttatus TaxID=293821 RepID=UPI0020D12A68|nr:uncharacterized protein LOC125885642 [Epinephelus fuscoguttatus]